MRPPAPKGAAMHTDRIAVVANIIKQHPNLLDQSRQSFFPDVRRGHPERESDAGDIASLTVAVAPQSTDEIRGSAEDILGLERLFDIPLLSPTWPVDWAETAGIDMAPRQRTRIVHEWRPLSEVFAPSAEQAFEILRWVVQHGEVALPSALGRGSRSARRSRSRAGAGQGGCPRRPQEDTGEGAAGRTETPRTWTAARRATTAAHDRHGRRGSRQPSAVPQPKVRVCGAAKSLTM